MHYNITLEPDPPANFNQPKQLFSKMHLTNHCIMDDNLFWSKQNHINLTLTKIICYDSF